jgi:hypothetical protein
MAPLSESAELAADWTVDSAFVSSITMAFFGTLGPLLSSLLQAIVRMDNKVIMAV